MLTVLIVGRPDAPDPSDLVPLLRTLVWRGMRVVLLAGEDQRPDEDAGIEFRVLPPLPLQQSMLPGMTAVGRARSLFRRLLIESMQVHWSVVERTMEQDRPDVLLADALCFAACMVAELPPAERPPVIVLGTIPPPHANPASAPYGLGILPSEALVNQARNRLLHSVTRHVILAPVLPELRHLFRRLTGHEMGRDTYDAAASAEVWAQCEPDRFEYPLHGAGNLQLVGPLTPAGPAALPSWWIPGDDREIIAVRAGGAGALHDLVVPAIHALSGRPGSRVVVTGVERTAVVAALGQELPDDVLVADDLAPGRTLPGTGVVLTRGWFVHALHALQQGVPVIAVGDGAEEAETAARLRWHGCGTGVRTDTPDPERLRAAVDRVLGDPSHQRAAARIAAQCAGMRAEEAIADLVENVHDARRPAAQSAPTP